MSQATTQREPSASSNSRTAAAPWWTLLALALGTATAIVAQTLVLPVLPAIADAFDISSTDALWVLTVNLMAATVFSPLLGRLGDAFGRKKVMVGALVAVAVGSLVCAVAGEFWLLLIGRVLQGTAFGVIALAISIVRDSFPPERVSLGIALLSAIMGIGGGAGLVLAGLLAEVGSFELIFWTSLGLATLGAVLVTVTAQESPRSAERHIDVPGAITLAGWLTCLLLAIDRGPQWGWAAPVVVSLFGAAAILLVVWIFVELRVRVPLVDMQVFRKPVVLGTNVTGMLIGLGMFGAFALINQFLQTPERVGYGFSADALETGLILLPMTLGTLIAAPLASLLINRIGPKPPMIVGALLAAAAFGALAIWNSEQWQFLLALSVMGLGIGQAMAAMPAALNLGVPRSQTGIANGMNSTLRELGSSTGSAFAGAVLATEVIPGTPIPTLDTFELAFALSAGACVIAAIAAMLIPQPCTGVEESATEES